MREGDPEFRDPHFLGELETVRSKKEVPPHYSPKPSFHTDTHACLSCALGGGKERAHEACRGVQSVSEAGCDLRPWGLVSCTTELGSQNHPGMHQNTAAGLCPRSLPEPKKARKLTRKGGSPLVLLTRSPSHP